MSHHRHKHYRRREPLPLDKDGMFHFERGVVEIGHPPENPFERDIKVERDRLKKIWYAYRLIDTGGKWTGNRNNYPYSPTVAFIDAKGNYYKILTLAPEFKEQKLDFEMPCENSGMAGYYAGFNKFLQKLANT